MKQALPTLKPQQQVLLWLAYVEGFEHREIAWFVGGAGVILHQEWPAFGNLVLTMPPYVYMAIAVGAAILAVGRRALRR